MYPAFLTAVSTFELYAPYGYAKNLEAFVNPELFNHALLFTSSEFNDVADSVVRSG